MDNEHVLWGVRKGNPDWMTEILTTDPAKFEDAKKWARENGFDRFRTAIIDLTTPPDFSSTVKCACRRRPRRK
jgi:hypothetical protein